VAPKRSVPADSALQDSTIDGIATSRDAHITPRRPGSGPHLTSGWLQTVLRMDHPGRIHANKKCKKGLESAKWIKLT
jgi:hypothetical protein